MTTGRKNFITVRTTGPNSPYVIGAGAFNGEEEARQRALDMAVKNESEYTVYRAVAAYRRSAPPVPPVEVEEIR